MRARLRLAVLCLLCWALGSACAVPEGPELLVVSAATPELIEPGGALVVSGRGFPAGRAGTLQLSGVRLVPGRDPEKVTVRWSAQAVSSARLVADLDDAELSELTGGAPHATFRGRIAVAFAPVRASAPALRGHLPEVALDAVRAHEPGTSSDFAAFIGVGLGPDLSVISVAPELPAERAGLRVGDQLHRLDGVRLLTLSDFAPRAHGATSLVEYSRPGYAGRAEALLERADYFRTDEARLWLVVSLGFASAVGLLVAARPPRAAFWLVQAARLGARGGLQQRAQPFGWFGLCLRAGLGAAGIVLLLGHGGSGGRLELPLVSGVGLGSLLLAAFLADGSQRRGFRLLAGLGSACLSLVGLLPVVLGWGVAAASAGTFSLTELGLSQKAAPLGAGLLASPWTLLSAGCYLGALLPVTGRRPLAARGAARRGAVRVSLATACEELGLVVALGIWVLLYGGALGSVVAKELTFALCFAELLLLFSLLHGARRLSGRVSRGESWSILMAPLVGTSLVVALVRLFLLRLDVDGAWEVRLRMLPLACLSSVCVWLALASLRSLSHHGRRADPWL